MTAERTCPKCGTMLSSDALEGLCPKCVGRGAFGHLEALGAEVLEAEFARLKPEEVGEQIGHYKLMEQIGQGGFGTVWVADQEKPVRRRVALKIIKLGMDTREVIARFEQERQALAMMDHPNIAKVFDAGMTEWGRPFFVMELVRGIKITDYCDQANLSTAERLALFIPVCNAVQHAHQKGIIHRDLKPSNILVTLHDGVPVPKVIDFGVAKATQQQRLTDLTIYTQFQQMIGTPLYMSPEQAEMSGLDIDTRSDIYSLGVLLYELLTGRTPFDPEELMRQGLDEIRRTIREQEPKKPSTFLSTMAFDLRAVVAQHRQVEGAKLIGLIRGDLDWIVMKALEKDRNRRYETATELASDIQRHLQSEPVLARPASQLYRFRRLAQRNKLAFAAAGAIAAALVIGIVVSTWQAIRATRAEREQSRLREVAQENAKAAQVEAAKSEQVATFLKDMLEGVQPSVALGRDSTMLREILDRTAERVGEDLTNQPAVEAELRDTLGTVYVWLGEYAKAEAMQSAALSVRKKHLGPEHADVATSLRKLGWVFKYQGKFSEAELLLREALGMRRKLLGSGHPAVAEVLVTLADVLECQQKFAEAESLCQEALHLRKKLFGAVHPDVARALGSLAVLYFSQGRLSEAEAAGREALAIERKVREPEHPETAIKLMLLAQTRRKQHNYSEAESLAREAYLIHKKCAGPANSLTAFSREELAQALTAQGQIAETIPLLAESSALTPEDTFMAQRVTVLQAWFGKNADYAVTCRRVVESAVGTDDPSTAERAAKGYCLLPSSDPHLLETALTLARRAVDIGKTHQYLPYYQMALGMAEYRSGSYPAADGSLTAAELAGKDNRHVREPTRFFRAMSLFQQGKAAEARKLFAEVEAQMKPPPADERQPFADGATPDDLIVWLAYKEAKTLLRSPR